MADKTPKDGAADAPEGAAGATTELTLLERIIQDGKISALYEAWTKGTTNARLVSSVDEVAGLVHELR